MTYVELIVVLSIFSIMAGVSIANYDKFEARIHVRNYANDIASQIAQAQKWAQGGEIPLNFNSLGWIPSYGIYFDKKTHKDSFIYFVDKPTQDKLYNTNSACGNSVDPATTECLEKFKITKGIIIEDFTSNSSGNASCPIGDDLHIVFTRSSSDISIISGGCSFSSVEIVIKSPKGISSTIEVNSSGRIQIK